jgi:hypothetical protein
MSNLENALRELACESGWRFGCGERLAKILDGHFESVYLWPNPILEGNGVLQITATSYSKRYLCH